MKRIIFQVLAALLMSACSEEKSEQKGGETSAPKAITNRISLPSSVRTNLGITFAKAERRSVASILRVPGQFELLPTARREYRVNLMGHVELLVQQFQEVESGQPLYRVNSPAWHRMRLALEEAHAAIERTEAEYQVAKEKLRDVERRVSSLEKRISSLTTLKVRRADLEADLSALKSSLPTLRAEVEARDTDHHEALHHLPIQEAEAASALRMTRDELRERIPHGGETQPRWRTLNEIVVKAVDSGRVEALHVANGSYAEENTLVVTTVQPRSVRFHASALQGDLGRLREGLPARIVPPQGGSFSHDEKLEGALTIGLGGDSSRRTVDLYVVPTSHSWWSRAGVSAFLEISMMQGDEEVAIPKGAVIQDGLLSYFFRRDPQDPDKVIKVEADLGISDERWVEVLSGIAEGDEVVFEGVYELKLSSGGQSPKGGHFHADGTWHADGEPEPK